jgi:hypothetical protein
LLRILLAVECSGGVRTFRACFLMAQAERITVTLPPRLVAQIDRVDGNRSGFLARAARRELRRLERKALKLSLDARVFTDEDRELEAAGLADYAASLPAEDCEAMIEPDAFKPIRWVPGTGWVEP